jgi:hypothetical protein
MPLAAQNARFVRASKFRSDENATLYVVAVSEPNHAIEIVRGKVADFSDDVEDLGRVSRALVRALDLAPGNIIRIDQQVQGIGVSPMARRCRSARHPCSPNRWTSKFNALALC